LKGIEFLSPEGKGEGEMEGKRNLRYYFSKILCRRRRRGSTVGEDMILLGEDGKRGARKKRRGGENAIKGRKVQKALKRRGTVLAEGGRAIAY